MKSQKDFDESLANQFLRDAIRYFDVDSVLKYLSTGLPYDRSILLRDSVAAELTPVIEILLEGVKRENELTSAGDPSILFVAADAGSFASTELLLNHFNFSAQTTIQAIRRSLLNGHDDLSRLLLNTLPLEDLRNYGHPIIISAAEGAGFSLFKHIFETVGASPDAIQLKHDHHLLWQSGHNKKAGPMIFHYLIASGANPCLWVDDVPDDYLENDGAKAPPWLKQDFRHFQKRCRR